MRSLLFYIVQAHLARGASGHDAEMFELMTECPSEYRLPFPINLGWQAEISLVLSELNWHALSTHREHRKESLSVCEPRQETPRGLEQFPA